MTFCLLGLRAGSSDINKRLLKYFPKLVFLQFAFQKILVFSEHAKRILTI